MTDQIPESAVPQSATRVVPDPTTARMDDVLDVFAPALNLLREYDDGYITSPAGVAPRWELTTAEARTIVAAVGARFPQDTLFGQDPRGRLDATIAAVYQSFDGIDLYPTAEQKAANLLYFVVKDHSLADGNKRSAAALFVTFLARNGMLNGNGGAARITNGTLAALTLLVATSDPSDKDLLVALITRVLSLG